MTKTKSRKNISWQRPIAMIAVVALLVSGFVPFPGTAAPKAYAHWADSYLQSLASEGVMKGDSNGNMYPDRNITRAEFAVMINQACGFTQKGSTTFSDVEPNAWYADTMKIANYQGFMKGSSSGTANPNAALTREEAVTMLCQALKLPAAEGESQNFTDTKKFSNWSKGYINAAVGRNILSGYPDGTFRPQSPITRGESARILDGLVGTIVNSGGDSYLGYVDGNVTLTRSGGGLRNTTITGDLYITEGVDTGYVFLDNVTVLGDIIISGGGQSNQSDNSIVLDGCNANNIIVDLNHNKTLSLIAQGDSDIKNVLVKTPAFLAENNARGEAFRNVDVQGATNNVANLSGSFDQVRIMAPGNTVRLNKGDIAKLIADENGPNSKIYLEKNTSVDELYIDAPVTTTGRGTISYLSIGVSGSVTEQLPDEIYIRPGVTGKVNGKDMGYLEGESQNLSPRVESGYPEVKEVTINSAKSLVKGNKPGTVYWAVKEAGESSPSEEDLRNPKNDEKILKSGNAALADEDKEISAAVSGLTTGKSYEIYVMLVDAKDDESRIRSEVFETLDKTAPKFIAGYPRGEAVYQKPESTTGSAMADGHNLAFEAVTDKDCTIYWAVLPAGSVAPSASNVVDGKVAGEVTHGTASGKLNEMVRFYAGGLAEATKYDVYMVLKDSKNNVSTLSKISLTTLDVTAPYFIPPYPQNGAVADTTVEQKVMTSENATVYWVVYKAGTKFPPGYIGSGTDTDDSGNVIQSDEWMKAAANAIKNGNSALKNGKLTTVSQKESSFTVTGLAPQTTYNLYLLMEDGSGNQRMLGPTNLITKDNINPTAKMAFDPALVSDEGYPPVGSDIRIVFNELVFVNGTQLDKITPSALGTYVKFYRTSTENKREEMTVDYDAVTFDVSNGWTEMIFKTTGKTTGGAITSGAALSLMNGSDYYFELSKSITDISENNLTFTPPNQQTAAAGFMRMELFHTMAPFVNLTPVNIFGDYKVIADIDPKIKDASPDLLFDIVLESDRNVAFKLYKAEATDGKPTTSSAFTPVKGDDQSTQFLIKKGQFISMRTLLKGGIPKVEEFTSFNDLKRTQYAIEIVELDGNSNSGAWDGKLTFSFRGVAGNGTGLQALASATSGTFDEFIRSTAATGNVSVVSDPTKLDCIAYFRDMVAPVFKPGYPTFGVGDMAIQLGAITDKPCKFYWIIAPTGTFDVTNKETMKKGVTVQDGQSGNFSIDNANALVTQKIKNLKPNTAYDIHYMLGASVDGEIQKYTTTTAIANTPQFVGSYPLFKQAVENGAIVEVKFSGGTAEVAWAVYPIDAYTNNTPSAVDISSGKSADGSEAIDSGRLSDLPEGVLGDFTAKNLKSNMYYACYVIARNPLGSDDAWTDPKKVIITAKDVLAPQVDPRSTSTVITATSGAVLVSYSGYAEVGFTEPLYYSPSNGTMPGDWAALTADVAKAKLKGTVASGIYLWNISGTTPHPSPGDLALNNISFRFDNANIGTIISLPYPIGDKVNVSGQGLYMRLKKDDTGVYWDVYFQ